MKDINIKADGIWLEPTWAVAGTRGSWGSSVMKVNFSSEWEGMRKRVTFFPSDGSDAVEVPIENNEAVIPDEVMEHAGTAEFVIDGEVDGRSLVTQKGELRIIDTARPGGKNPLLFELKEELERLKARLADGIAVL
jgi:hypothetical protein